MLCMCVCVVCVRFCSIAFMYDEICYLSIVQLGWCYNTSHRVPNDLIDDDIRIETKNDEQVTNELHKEERER